LPDLVRTMQLYFLPARGDDAAAATNEDFAALLTAQIGEESHELQFKIMYSATPPPHSSPEEQRPSEPPYNKPTLLGRGQSHQLIHLVTNRRFAHRPGLGDEGRHLGSGDFLALAALP